MEGELQLSAKSVGDKRSRLQAVEFDQKYLIHVRINKDLDFLNTILSYKCHCNESSNISKYYNVW